MKLRGEASREGGGLIEKGDWKEDFTVATQYKSKNIIQNNDRKIMHFLYPMQFHQNCRYIYMCSTLHEGLGIWSSKSFHWFLFAAIKRWHKFQFCPET